MTFSWYWKLLLGLGLTCFGVLGLGLFLPRPGRRVEPQLPTLTTQKAPEPASVPAEPPPVTDGFAESIGIQIIPLPEGEFQMGADAKDPFSQTEQRPRHRVRIPAGRGLSVHEVTVGQYRRFVEDTQYKSDAEQNPLGGIGSDEQGKVVRDPRFNWTNPGFEQSDSHPVVNVSWNDAIAFCRWLTEKDGQTYRLPTEAEWEYACRAGTQTTFIHGDDSDNIHNVANIADAALRHKNPKRFTETIASDDTFPNTAPVGQFQPNAWGFKDMCGNVWEWCQDYFDMNYYVSSPELDPQGPLKASGHSVRGGGWECAPRNSTTSCRSGVIPHGVSTCIGFRVARVAAEP